MNDSHQQYLLDYYRKLAESILSGTLTPENFANEQAKARIELEKRAQCDGLLTTFLNSNTFLKTLEQWLELARRLHLPAVLLALDIDSFKRFNDTFGHPEGDRLIKLYAAIIEQQTRTSDLRGRVGGDEFAIFLIGSDLENAKMVAERIRTGIIHAVKEAFPQLSWEQTISIGIAQVENNDNADSLRNKADKALYAAKENRNDIIVAGVNNPVYTTNFS